MPQKAEHMGSDIYFRFIPARIKKKTRDLTNAFIITHRAKTLSAHKQGWISKVTKNKIGEGNHINMSDVMMSHLK